MQYQQKYRVAVWKTKHKPKPNTVILTNVTAVNSANKSDTYTEPACFLRLRNLCVTCTMKSSQAALYCIQLLNAMCVRF